MNDNIKLKNNVDFQVLSNYGFTEDGANCDDPQDRYYHLNNWYIQLGNFRITVNTNSRHIDVLCLPEDSSVHNIYNLIPLYRLIADGLVEKG